MSVFIIVVFVLVLILCVNKKLRKNDPVHNCKVYLNEGCSHVDGPLCDMDTCGTCLYYPKKGETKK